jgi:hypothetical protein
LAGVSALSVTQAKRSRSGTSIRALEIVELGLREVRDMDIGEPAHDQVHLARAAMPRAEEDREGFRLILGCTPLLSLESLPPFIEPEQSNGPPSSDEPD